MNFDIFALKNERLNVYYEGLSSNLQMMNIAGLLWKRVKITGKQWSQTEIGTQTVNFTASILPVSLHAKKAVKRLVTHSESHATRAQ